MKKRISIIIAAVALASFCLTSCNKEKSSNPDPTPKPVTAEVEFIAAMLEGQDTYVDQSYEIEIGGKKTTINFSQMTEVSKKSPYTTAFEKIETCLEVLENTNKFKVYKYSVGTLKENQTVNFGAKTYTAKSSRPSGETDILDAYGMIINGKEYSLILDSALFAGTDCGTELEDLCAILTKSMKLSYTVK